jgi:hypothetical protein
MVALSLSPLQFLSRSFHLNVLARCNPLIAALGQFLGESLKQTTTGATTQLLDM